jgi:hypothetical protein
VAHGAVIEKAHAFDAGEVAGDPILVDITASTSYLVSVDNRNTRPSAVSSFADDDWQLWYNRLGTRVHWGIWEANLQIHSAVFPVHPDATEVALDVLELERETEGRAGGPYTAEDAQFFLLKLNESGQELSNRYIHWTYVPKYSLGVNTEHVEATVGDFYGQLGRGLVLSIRKIDELGSDTTIRGARITGKFKAGDVGFRITGLGGTGNPLRIDEASGRYLSVNSSVTPNVIAVTEAGMPRAITSDFETEEQPTYAPDSIFGAQIEGGPKIFKLGVQGSMIRRQEEKLTQDVVRTADRALTGSVSLNIPTISDFGTAYVEVAAQDLAHDDQPQTDLTGHAVYGALSLFKKPIAITLEGKHYRRFFPLTANTDTGRAREFTVQYNAPPTTEAFWIDTAFDNFNTCTTGGRAKTDLRVGKNQSVFGWVGYYHTWAESDTNVECETEDRSLNRVWDLASGFELKYQEGKSGFQTTVGARFDDTDTPIPDSVGNLTNRFYREGYVRYDIIQYLAGPLSAQVIGWHRRRSQTFGGPEGPWNEGENLTALQWSPLGSLVFGFEYDTNPATPTLYFNGQVNVNVTDYATVGLFAGQRRGAIRCAGGVCRFFPPFEGGRLDATVRF